jgi:hypothetical protein
MAEQAVHGVEPEAHGAPAAAGHRFWFRPVHPLNFNLRQLLLEQEQAAPRWPGVTRYVMAHIDNQGLLGVLVGFRPGSDPGHIDNVRCFRAMLGRAADYPDPLAALGPLADAISECELQFGDVLEKLYGHGVPRAAVPPVTRDPAAARLRE